MERQKSSDRPKAAKRVALNMKATPQLRGRIDKAADESGLSIAQEVERRLIESFRADDALGGRHTAALLRSLAGIFELAEASTGKSWREDWETFSAVRAATLRTLADYAPSPPAEIESLSSASEKARGAWDAARATYEIRMGFTPNSLSVLGPANAISALSAPTHPTFPENDPNTGLPWTREALQNVRELGDEVIARASELSTLSGKLKHAMQPVTEGRQRGLQLADDLLGADVGNA